MRRIPIRRSGLVLLSLLLPVFPLAADEEKELRELLRDALYTEEVTRDAEAAARQYEALISRHDAQRAFAASALFRLAEVRRKQDRRADAIALYQRLIREFPAATAEAKLATENLATLGGKAPEGGDAPPDEQTQELARLASLEKTGPDLLRDPKTLENAVKKGWPRVVAVLLDAGNDPYRSQAFLTACASGYLEICRLMWEKRGNPPAQLAQDAMAQALHNERLEVVKFLLQKGVDPDAAGLLAISVRKWEGRWDKSLTEFVLKAGVNLDRLPEHTSEPFNSDENRWHFDYGTALHDALSWRNLDAANLLLDRGCKPDLATADDGIAPLHIALYLEGKEATDLVRRLLAAGADPNRRTLKTPDLQPGEPRPAMPRNSDWESVAPLEIALRFPNLAAIKLLLEAGAKPEWPRTWRLALEQEDPQVFASLLDAADDPPVKDLLRLAVELGNVNAVQRLIDAGASPLDPGLLEEAAKRRRLVIAKLLLEKGAVPDEDWARSQLSGSWGEIKPLLFQRVVVPRLLEKPAIHFVSTSVGWSEPREVIAKAGSEPLLPLAELLLTAKDLVWPRTSEVPATMALPVSGNSALRDDHLRGASRLTIWRKDEQGQTVSLVTDLIGTDPFPELQWGDALQLDFNEDGGQPMARNIEFSNSPTPEIAWALQRRISSPVTLEIDGKLQELTLRGDRLIHDPTSTEVPWCDVANLVAVRWQPGVEVQDLGVTLSITRKEWPEIRLPFPSDEASQFFLRAGDQVKVEIPSKIGEALAEARPQRIAVRAAGLPYAWSLPCARGNLDTGASSMPTLPPLVSSLQPSLCQVLVQTQAAPDYWAQYTRLSADLLPKYLRAERYPATVVPYPDWSRIRILRLKEGGAEETIEVDLSRWIEDAGASAEEIKKHDIALQPGDIVELRVREDRPAGPWKGLSDKEEAFFAKALQGRIQVVGSDSQMRLEELRYRAPDFIETPAGWIPRPPATGHQSVLASSFLGNTDRMDLTRGGERFQDVGPKLLFLRDGDQIKPTGGPRSPRPRQAVVPPPIPGR